MPLGSFPPNARASLSTVSNAASAASRAACGGLNWLLMPTLLRKGWAKIAAESLAAAALTETSTSASALPAGIGGRGPHTLCDRGTPLLPRSCGLTESSEAAAADEPSTGAAAEHSAAGRGLDSGTPAPAAHCCVAETVARAIPTAGCSSSRLRAAEASAIASSRHLPPHDSETRTTRLKGVSPSGSGVPLGSRSVRSKNTRRRSQCR